MKKRFPKIMLSICTAAVLMATSASPAFAARTKDDYSDFIRGADVSMLKEIEDLGGKYYDKGVQKDALRILKDHGANYVRLRLWVNPYSEKGESYGGGGNDYKTTLALAKRAKSLGMKVLIDCHLSDYWADPGTQSKPKAWKNLSYADLQKTVYNYMKNTMNDFKRDGVVPDMVQVGNETSSGILWSDGKVGGTNSNFKNLAGLMYNAISGLRASVGHNTKVILHLDNGGNNSLYRWWFDSIMSCGYNIDFDIIGLTYYPMWHGTLDQLQYNLDDISKKYNKDVAIVETAYAFTTADGDGLGSSFSPSDAKIGGYPATVAGQKAFMKDLESVLLNVPDNHGLGFFYWEPEWTPVKGANWGTEAGKKYIGDNGILSNPWDNLALFDFKGNALDSMSIFNVPDTNKVSNNSFEQDGYTNKPSGWNVWLDKGVSADTIKTETSAFSGNYKLSFYNDKAYKCSVYKNISGLQNGTYTLSAWVMSSGKQKTCQLYAKNYGGKELKTSFPACDRGWNKVTIKNIKVTNGQVEIGLYADANAKDWCNLDNVILRRD